MRRKLCRGQRQMMADQTVCTCNPNTRLILFHNPQSAENGEF
jgi:hypothetical protein